ncbi:copper chaperone PCu(A)C [Pseudomarimonas salicorniae]|uniref:Copper chaperone PCu(A)C n=1 Tax=Pseudomarimonas salicorniae TaxID=2933270 RepID=A0ABT0GM36_9GAMM|nr:copper chaperone PCu(A)C [Lysobacter sp. CAU 1642]MCK7595274.1 copper chaperone PCu(A)C [Lysobacter sp. CAU 1642]
MLRSLACGLLLALFAAPALAEQIVVESPWIRAAPPSARMLAGYAVLHNRGEAERALVGASSTRFGLVEIHETVEVDGIARMREVPRLSIPAGESTSLEPGGRHLMLMRPTSVPAEGEQVEIVLRFDDGSEQPVAFEVRREAVGSDEGHDHHHDH